MQGIHIIIYYHIHLIFPFYINSMKNYIKILILNSHSSLDMKGVRIIIYPITLL
jgi:hypothetical protein